MSTWDHRQVVCFGTSIDATRVTSFRIDGDFGLFKGPRPPHVRPAAKQKQNPRKTDERYVRRGRLLDRERFRRDGNTAGILRNLDDDDDDANLENHFRTLSFTVVTGMFTTSAPARLRCGRGRCHIIFIACVRVSSRGPAPS